MLKTLGRVLKRVFQFVGILFTVVILAGLTFRALGPKPHAPLGKLVHVNGMDLHIHPSGIKNDKPTVVIEGGGGLQTEYYHWLSEGLKDSLRVVRYDRAGVGYSDLGNTARDAQTVARELHQLLEEAGESPPYILAGHSLGGPYIRVFTQLYPDEVAGLVFMDATHPEQVERFNAAPASSVRFKSVIWGLNVAIFFADVGVLGLAENLIGPIFPGEGLPDEINPRLRDMLLDGKRLRGYKHEIENYHAILDMAKAANQFDSIPIIVCTAIEMNKESYRKRGIDPEEYLNQIIENQKEYIDLSSNGKQILIDGNHQTIFTKKENADRMNREIVELANKIGS
ncbi:MAG: alpha/beta hydrolase [Bacteroidota bacterium]